jgi:hypothetical protein
MPTNSQRMLKPYRRPFRPVKAPTPTYPVASYCLSAGLSRPSWKNFSTKRGPSVGDPPKRNQPRPKQQSKQLKDLAKAFTATTTATEATNTLFNNTDYTPNTGVRIVLVAGGGLTPPPATLAQLRTSLLDIWSVLLSSVLLAAVVVVVVVAVKALARSSICLVCCFWAWLISFRRVSHAWTPFG